VPPIAKWRLVTRLLGLPPVAWLGDPFDPGGFDLQAINATLRGLKLYPDQFLLDARALFLVHLLSLPPLEGSES
jgi:hypothetical protein